MKHHKLFFVWFPACAFLVLSMGTHSCKKMDQKYRIEQAIRHELRMHPKATLQDIYKNFFQDAFGPGHMIPDSAKAMDYLEYELQNAGSFDTVLIQPLGYKNRHYRINLSLVRDSALTKHMLFNAFVTSANNADPPTMEEWIDTWDRIIQVIEEMEPGLPNYESDKIMLSEQLKKGDPVVHHSAVYKEAYSPHYRIVNEEMYHKIRKYLQK